MTLNISRKNKINQVSPRSYLLSQEHLTNLRKEIHWILFRLSKLLKNIQNLPKTMWNLRGPQGPSVAPQGTKTPL